jgi:hypothetical protein
MAQWARPGRRLIIYGYGELVWKLGPPGSPDAQHLGIYRLEISSAIVGVSAYEAPLTTR